MDYSYTFWEAFQLGSTLGQMYQIDTITIQSRKIFAISSKVIGTTPVTLECFYYKLGMLFHNLNITNKCGHQAFDEHMGNKWGVVSFSIFSHAVST